jgi:polysaccharide biosynthesis protein PslH
LHILFVTPYVPSSMRIRPLAFIRELAQRGHHVTLACLVQPEWEASYLSEVTPYCKSVHPIHLSRYEPYLRTLTSLATSTPLSVAYCNSQKFRSTVEQLARSNGFDILHTEFVRAAPATIHLNHIPKVFDLVDCMSLAYRRSIRAANVPLKQRAVAAVEWMKMRGYENRTLQHYQRILVSSPVDQKELRTQKPAEIIPNGVDLDYFAYSPEKSPSAEIIFLGKMSYYVNIASVLWFYKHVFPLIRKIRPDAKFLIVGRNPAQVIKNLASDPAVEVTGTVPDVRPYLQRAAVAICPMVSGAGIQNKMLEAMAVGAPCVATNFACQALEIEPNKQVFVADKAEDFANCVLELLNTPSKRREVSTAARTYIEDCHNWTVIGARLEKVFSDCIETH